MGVRGWEEALLVLAGPTSGSANELCQPHSAAVTQGLLVSEVKA